MPIGHIGINVTDLGRSKAYYDALMPLLGYEPFIEHDDEFAYRPIDAKPGTYLFVYPALERGSYSSDATGLQHLAFIVRTRAAVADAHAKAIELGSPSVHEPQDWPQYPPPYHAAFWRDPDGLLLEAVCHHDRD